MERIIKTIKNVTKSEGISVEPLRCPSCGGGKLVFIGDDTYQCSYCDGFAKLVGGKIVADIDESNGKNIKEQLTEEAMKPIVDALNDGTRETQTIVSVDKESKKEKGVSIANIIFIDVCVFILYFGIIGYEGLANKIVSNFIVCALNYYMLKYGRKPFGNKNKDNDESPDTEEIVENNEKHI